MKRVAALLLFGLAGCEPGCFRSPLGELGALSQGDYSPTNTIFAIVDRYEDSPIHDGGTYGLKKREHPTLTIVMSRAAFDPEVDIAALPQNEREDLIHEIATQHSLLIEGIPLDRVRGGNTVAARRPPMTGDFTFVMRRPGVGSTPNQSYTNLPPLGGDQALELVFGSVSLDAPVVQLQRVNVDTMKIDIKLLAAQEPVDLDAGEPADGAIPDAAALDGGAGDGSVVDAAQPDAASRDGGDGGAIRQQVGAVTPSTIIFTPSLPVIAERLGESNLAILRAALTTE